MHRFGSAVVVVALLASTACSTASSAQDRLGTIDFPTSGSASAQGPFIRGVLFLHSFEYNEAAAEFRKAQAADSGFAMAYWGEAMTQTHPVWNEQNLSAARTILNRLAATAEARQAKAPTHREKMYLEAVEALYGEGSKARRDTLYSQAMKRIVDAHSEDVEAKAFYALSLLGLNQGVRDVKTYLRAGEIASAIFKAYPDHPGAAHYVIHSYDDPDHAALGLEAARAYSKIAPGAAHAQHMTTHIFFALGMWDEGVSQNEIASGHDHDAWRPGHYTIWLHYAYLQQGRYADAYSMLERMGLAGGKDPGGREALGFTLMRGRQLIESEDWDSPVVGWTGASVPPQASGYWAFVSGFRAARKGDEATARAELKKLELANKGPDADATDVIAELELKALIALGDGKADEAVAFMRQATAREDGMPVEFGPPVVSKPSHELFGEILLQIGKPAEARDEFARALALAPRRARSLLGLVRAAKAAGDQATAARAQDDLKAVWHRADPTVMGELTQGT